MDYYYSFNRSQSIKVSKSPYQIAEETSHHHDDYSLINYLAYAYYIPLFLAGPITTFNAFFGQVKTPQTTYSFRQTSVEFIKVLVYMLVLEIWLHFFYVNSFNEYHVWKSHRFPGIEVCMLGLWVLNFMYMKFLSIWRFFRVLALFDGIDTPENMNRCVNNNFTFTGFWRSWHGSLNKWIVRYLYVPLGGSKKQNLSIWIIFSFVGLWHDLQTRWLAWALCNCVFFSLELVVTKFFSKLTWLHNTWYYRRIRGIAGGFNIGLLCVTNLAIMHGFKTMPTFLSRAFLEDGSQAAILGSLAWMICTAMVLQELRATEQRNNKSKRF